MLALVNGMSVEDPMSDEWKKSWMVPVNEKADVLDFWNYRGIKLMDSGLSITGHDRNR